MSGEITDVSEAPKEIKLVRKLKTMTETEVDKSNLSQSDWTGIISMTILVSYVGLIVTKYVLSVEIEELGGLGAAVGLIVGWYLRGKL